jgi:hypothetical protein
MNTSLTFTRAGPTIQKQEYNWGLYPEYYATYPEDILQSMDTQFSKWSYDLNEGATAIPFVMAQAPAETHARLVKHDRSLWAEKAERPDNTTPIVNYTVEMAPLEDGRDSRSEPHTPAEQITHIKNGTSDEKRLSYNDKLLTRRAALIAKNKATQNSLLVTTKSVSQIRSAMHNNMHRRSVILSLPPTLRKQEQEPKAESPPEQTRPSIFILSQSEEQQQREVKFAIRENRIDFNNTQHLVDLMSRLQTYTADDNEKTSEGHELCVSAPYHKH